MKPALEVIYRPTPSLRWGQSNKVTAVGSGRYSLNNPIKSDGTLTKYAQLIMLVAKYPGLTRMEILERMGYVKPNRSHICSTFQALIAGGLIQHRRNGRNFHYFSGRAFDHWKQNYLRK